MLENYVEGYNKKAMNQRDKDRSFFLKHFQNLVLQYDYIVIFHHTKPDGDCLGAAFGLKEVILSNYPNKKVYVVGSKPNDLFPWMTMKFDNVINYDFDFFNAMAIIVDVAQGNRIDSFDRFFKNNKISFGAVVKIDHHDCPSDFHVDLSWDDPTYVSTCCQIVQLADFYGWKLTPKAATFLYLGICTDSLRFSVNTVVPRSLILAAKAWRAGADYTGIHNRLSIRTWDQVRLSKYLLDNAIKTDHVIYGILNPEEMAEFKVGSTKAMVSVYQNIENLWIWMLFMYNPGGFYEVSIRSFRVSAKDLAIKYGGNGHEFAAGCIVNKEQIEDLVKDADEMVDTAKKEFYYESTLRGEDADPEEVARIKEAVIRKNPQVVEASKDILNAIAQEREAGEYDVEEKVQEEQPSEEPAGDTVET